MMSLRDTLWIGQVIKVVLGALALAKLVTLLGRVGLAGLPGAIIQSYSEVMEDIERFLIEVPFDIHPAPWIKHALVLYGLFVGTNYRFLTRKGGHGTHGETIWTGVGDVGRGTRRGTLGQPAITALNLIAALSGPVFAVFVLLMYFGNVRKGPSGTGRWGDALMIGNRLYTVRISGLYLLILALQPIVAAALLVWNEVS